LCRSVDVIATPRTNEPQFVSFTAAISTAFTDLTDTPPKAAYCARVRDSLVLANINDGSEGDQYRLQWSAIGNAESWPTPGSASALSTQAGEQDLLSDLGDIRGIIGGEKFGLIFQKYGITRMTYVGGSAVFQFDTFEKKEGLNHFLGAIVGSPVLVNGITYFLNRNGVFATDGYKTSNLSAGKITEALFADRFNHPDSHDGTSAVSYSGAYSPTTNSIFWPYRVDDGSGQRRLLIYNILLNQFTTAPIGAVDVVMEGQISTIDGPFAFTVGTDILEAFTSTSSIGMVMQTGYIELAPGMRAQIKGAHLLGANLQTPVIGVKVADDYANVDLDQDSFTTMTSPARDIKFTTRDTGRFFSFRITGNQNTDAILRGIRIYFEPTSQA